MSEQSPAPHAPFPLHLRLNIAKYMLVAFDPKNYLKLSEIIGLESSGDIRPLSMQQFFALLPRLGLISDPYPVMWQITSIADQLVSNGLLQKMPGASLPPPLGNTFYAMHGGATKAQAAGDLWLSESLGPELIIRSYIARTVQISGRKSNGDASCGTGLLLDNHHILTNAHVVTDMTVDEILWTPKSPPVDSPESTIDAVELRVEDSRYHETGEFSHANPVDVAILEVTGLGETYADGGGIAFRGPGWSDSAWSFGYPPVPQAAEPAVVVHRGEVVNPQVQNQRRNDMMLFSATARPGNSGGPIVAQDGRVIGIVAEDLGVKDSAEVPFYAGVPTHEIARALNEMGYPDLLNLETWEAP
ncbi:S1 family peptidase [Rhodococcus opacus]|uniref:S1 family peptidase n=1 Tax=Rhodococcus opacus TaxID=37919 RepID=UPI0011D13ED5|nr:serine protease [Rhodococcus opacus]